jgi:hypothetical protein
MKSKGKPSFFLFIWPCRRNSVSKLCKCSTENVNFS